MTVTFLTAIGYNVVVLVVGKKFFYINVTGLNFSCMVPGNSKYVNLSLARLRMHLVKLAELMQFE